MNLSKIDLTALHHYGLENTHRQIHNLSSPHFFLLGEKKTFEQFQNFSSPQFNTSAKKVRTFSEVLLAIIYQHSLENKQKQFR